MMENRWLSLGEIGAYLVKRDKASKWMNKNALATHKLGHIDGEG